MKNIVYAGVLAALLEIDMEDDRASCSGRSSRSKKALLESNVKALELGYNYAQGAFRVSAAAARGAHGDNVESHPDRRQHGRGAGLCVCGRDGRGVVSDHAVDVADGRVQEFLQQWRVDPQTGKRNYLIVQARMSWPRSAW